MSLTKLDTYRACRRQYWYRYVVRASSALHSATLLYGKTVHACIERYLSDGTDPVTLFGAEWSLVTASHAITYTKTMSESDLAEIGRLSLTRFVEFWDESGLAVAVDCTGAPLLEVKLGARIAPGITLWGVIDLIAVDAEGRALILDQKTPASPCDPDFPNVADQLTDYQVLAEANADRLQLPQIERLGYIELIKRKPPKTKRGRGPTVEMSKLAPARTDQEKTDWVAKVVNDVHDIRRGCFPRDPGPAYRMACDMCDFRNHCHYGTTAGLVVPEDREHLLQQGPPPIPIR